MSGHPSHRASFRGGLVFVGFMGSGKSSVGRIVARRLGLPFADSDARIEELYGPIDDIFARQGEVSFRALEREVVLGLLADARDRPVVLALGGGAVTDPDVRLALRAARVVWLSAPPELLWRRVAGVRPLARDRASFRRLFDERETLYRDVADVTVDAGASPDEVADAVVRGQTNAR